MVKNNNRSEWICVNCFTVNYNAQKPCRGCKKGPPVSKAVPQWDESRFQEAMRKETSFGSVSESLSLLKYIISRCERRALETFSSLLASPFGLSLIKAALAVDYDPDLIGKGVLPFIQLAFDTLRGVRQSYLDVLCYSLFRIPFLMPNISQFVENRENLSISSSYLIVLRDWIRIMLQKDYEGTRSDFSVAAIVKNLFLHCPKEMQALMDIVNSTTNSKSGKKESERLHDNDFDDFRRISIYPTADEIYRNCRNSVPNKHSALLTVNGYLDYCFRSLREDSVQSICQEINLLTADRNKRLSKLYARIKERLEKRSLRPIEFADLHFGNGGEHCCSSIRVKFPRPIALQNILRKQGLDPNCSLSSLDPEDEKRRNVFRKICAEFAEESRLLQSDRLVALFSQHSDNKGTPIFLSLARIADSRQNPFEEGVVFLSFPSAKDWLDATLRLGKFAPSPHVIMSLTQLNSPFFAYAPFLERLQNIVEIPFQNKLLRGNFSMEDLSLSDVELSYCHSRFTLDESQQRAIDQCFRQNVSLIQGPPGTGKSLCGSLIVKRLLSESPLERILCVCYTNHALDQFLEHCIDLDIDKNFVCRIGSSLKTRDQLQSVNLSTLRRQMGRSRNSQYEFNEITKSLEEMKEQLAVIKERIHLPRSVEDWCLIILNKVSDVQLEALRCPTTTTIRNVSPTFVLEKWLRGAPISVCPKKVSDDFGVWQKDTRERNDLFNSWKEWLIEEWADEARSIQVEIEEMLLLSSCLREEADLKVLKSRSVIGCTTTGAAKLARLLEQVEPTVLLVEEASEVLEAHILTVLSTVSSNSKGCKVILIGDHQQLRPKINCYGMSVEASSPIRLNESLFERLVISHRLPYVCLSTQHRMRPEISQLLRLVAYPNLLDAESTMNRKVHPELPAFFTEPLLFLNHNWREDNTNNSNGSEETLSKSNLKEAEFIVKMIKSLFQSTAKGQLDSVVLLTPYLAQLVLLRNLIRQQVSQLQLEIQESDCQDLAQFFGISHVNSGGSSRRNNSNGNARRGATLTLSTVDNYQGEESEIAIVSLVRSNPNRQAGFLNQPERVNVLLSRARDCLILVGSIDTVVKEGNPWDQIKDHLTIRKAE